MNSPSQDVEVIPQLTYPPDSSQHPSTSIGRARRDTSLSVGQIFESLPLTREHLKCCFALFFVFVMEAWEMMIIVYTSPLIAREFKLSSVAVGNLMGAMFVGMGIGSIIWGPISDRIGRKKTIISSFMLYGILSLASAFSPDYSTLYALRLMCGVAAAGVFVVVFPYFTELLPVRSRGPFTTYLVAGWPVGVFFALGATIWLTPMGWRWVLGMSSLAGLWALVVAWLVPESPYWLVGVGRPEQARASILRLSRGATVISPQQNLHVEKVTRGAWRKIFSGRVLPMTLLQIAINFTLSWGYWGLQTLVTYAVAAAGPKLAAKLRFYSNLSRLLNPGWHECVVPDGKVWTKESDDCLYSNGCGRRVCICKLANDDGSLCQQFLACILQPGCLGSVGHMDRRNVFHSTTHSRL